MCSPFVFAMFLQVPIAQVSAHLLGGTMQGRVLAQGSMPYFPADYAHVIRVQISGSQFANYFLLFCEAKLGL